MRVAALSVPLLLSIAFAVPVFAEEVQQPDLVVESMAHKLVRGVTNMATGIVELPKQTYLTVRDEGAVGLVIGPLKGVGMALYRTLMGTTETAFFLVPQPGFYDPMIDPEFVWNGWSTPHGSLSKDAEANNPVERKGE